MDLHKLKAHSSWDDLRVVLAVARTGSLSAAARELAVNHSTVLRRVAAFETGTGVAMFLRQANAYLLTPAGEEMVAAALRMDDEFNAGLLRILGMDGRPSGTVKVTTVDTIAHHVLPSHLEAFERAHPEISVAIDVSETPCDLGRGEADVAIRCLTSTPSPPDNLVGRPISGIAFAAYGPSGRGSRRSGIVPLGRSRRTLPRPAHGTLAGAERAAIAYPHAGELGRHPVCRRQSRLWRRCAAVRAGRPRRRA
ncbi:MAG: LysR family transcriptional regulator [Magnetospirillum sp.]|nr:LysR family transcriptional regulator [Magnetospirillum sp.]